MNFTNVLSTMLELFAVLILGYALGKRGVIDSDGNKMLSRLIVLVTSPLLIISSVSGEELSADTSMVWKALVIGFLFYAAAPLLGWIFVKMMHVAPEDGAVYQLMYVFSNAAFLGFPVLRVVLGEEAIFYAAIINIWFNVMLYSYGVVVLARSTGKENTRVEWKRMINPGIISALLALLLHVFHISLPSTVQDFCSMVGEITIPLSMLVIGVSLSFENVVEMFRNKKMYFYCVVRLLILPAITWIVLGLFIQDSYLQTIFTVIAAMPAATLTVVLSNEYGGNTTLAANGVFLSTLFSIITIPLIALFCNYM
ncbi:MAG: AEC family transporter [Lachnospiraceae bacterium]